MGPHQKLGGQVTDNLAVLFLESPNRVDKQLLHAIPHRTADRKIIIVRGCVLGPHSLLIEQFIGKAAFEFVYGLAVVIVVAVTAVI